MAGNRSVAQPITPLPQGERRFEAQDGTVYRGANVLGVGTRRRPGAHGPGVGAEAERVGQRGDFTPSMIPGGSRLH
jgi:hypothetical protein